MLNVESTIEMAAIASTALVGALLAQTNNGLAPDIAPWANLAAVGVIVALFAWLLIYHIPSREKSSEQRQDAREARSEARLDKIQEQFLAALKYREDTSRTNAASGHDALSKLLDSQREVVGRMDRIVEQQKELCNKLVK